MKHGDDRLTQRAERLLKKTAEDPATGCWNWLGARTARGYPTVAEVVEGRRTTTTVTRVIFTAFHRDLRPSEVVHHKCSNPSCVRPDHLEGITETANIGEMHLRKSYEATIDYAEQFISDVDDALHDCMTQDREVTDGQDV